MRDRKRGSHLSSSARAKISAALRGRKHPHKGHVMSAAARAKLSRALRGRHLSASARAKISAALRGKHHAGHPMSAAAKAKLSAALKGRRSPHRGHPMSAETKAKLRVLAKARALAKSAARTAALRAAHPKRHAGVRKPSKHHKLRLVKVRRRLLGVGVKAHKSVKSGPRRVTYTHTKALVHHPYRVLKGSLRKKRGRHSKIKIHRIRVHRVWRRRRR